MHHDESLARRGKNGSASTGRRAGTMAGLPGHCRPFPSPHVFHGPWLEPCFTVADPFHVLIWKSFRYAKLPERVDRDTRQRDQAPSAE